MATTNPAVVRAYSDVAQGLFTISYPFLDTHQFAIAGVSKADPAVVSVPETNTPIVSATGTVGTIVGSVSPWTAVITGMTDVLGLTTGMIITATDGVGTIGTGSVIVTSILGNTSVAIKCVGGTAPTAGTVTDITIPATGLLPEGLKSGSTVTITDVAGMTQLATAGIDGSNKFTVGAVTATTFELAGVDSSLFSIATANTGVFQAFTVPQYNTVGSTANVVFNAVGPVVGTDIAVDADTGVISVVGGDLVYSFYASATVNVPGATYQFYDLTSEQTLGLAVPAGTPLTLVWTPAADADVCLLVTAPAGTTFQYPAQVFNAQLVVDVVSGFVA